MSKQDAVFTPHCNSCGAGLKKTSGSCKCEYCGSINLIHSSGATVVLLEKKAQAPKAEPETSKGSGKVGWIMLIIGVVVLGSIGYFIYNKYCKKTKIYG
jgi:predicted ATP-dependent serine protease